MTTEAPPRDETAFAAYVRDQLRPFVAEFADGASGESSDRIAAVEEFGADQVEQLARARRLQRQLFDAGIAWPSGPPELGGLGLDLAHDSILDDVIAEFDLPSREPLFVGLNIVAPALVHHAAPDLRYEVVRGLFRGDTVGCQLFSEPGAGSDLASVATRAERDGDEWVLNGQKVWTSMGQVADVGEALVRTDREASKHAGLSMFLVDMHAPGVTVRPIRQMTGGSAFNEVFLDDVRVPDSHRIGELGEGWRVAATSLGAERATMSGAAGPITPHTLDRLTQLVRRLGADQDPAHAQRIARTVSAVTAMRAASGLTAGSWSHSLEGVAGSILKMMMVRAADQISDLAQAVLGEDAYVDRGEPDAFAWSEFILGVPGLHIAGGTDEIQLNVIAQRGLGLPRPGRPTRNSAT